MVQFRQVMYGHGSFKGKRCLLAGDIGGTNSNFGILEDQDGTLVLLVSFHYHSKEITDFPQLVADLVSYVRTTFTIVVEVGCFGAAGVISELRDFVRPTNLTFAIDAHVVAQRAGLRHVVIINDFEAVGYGAEKIAKKDLIVIRQGNPRPFANKAIIGAGTGLGKGIMGWDSLASDYIPVPSEGGHADFAVQTNQELELIEFIRKTEQHVGNVSWEDIVSGNGIKRIYRFLGTMHTYEDTPLSKEIVRNGLHPDLIFNYRNEDQRCKETFELFAQWYGRCGKNFALDALALAGMYIAGGIAAKNRDLFAVPCFFEEFINCRKQKKLLESVPIYLIADYNVSLYGAAHYLVLHKRTLS